MLTKLTDEQRGWVAQAARELEMTHPEIVQIAVDRLINQWDKAKSQVVMEQAQKMKAEIDERIAELQAQKDSVDMKFGLSR